MLALQRFEYLEAKQKRGGLTVQERLKLCELAAQLKFRVGGCR